MTTIFAWLKNDTTNWSATIKSLFHLTHSVSCVVLHFRTRQGDVSAFGMKPVLLVHLWPSSWRAAGKPMTDRLSTGAIGHPSHPTQACVRRGPPDRRVARERLMMSGDLNCVDQQLPCTRSQAVPRANKGWFARPQSSIKTQKICCICYPKRKFFTKYFRIWILNLDIPQINVTTRKKCNTLWRAWRSSYTKPKQSFPYTFPNLDLM